MSEVGDMGSELRMLLIQALTIESYLSESSFT
jgi:hypothetical protein